MNEERERNHKMDATVEVVVRKWEESAGGRRFCMLYPKGSFFGFERRILSERCCPYVLPMSFIEEEGGLSAYYDCSGCLPLKDFVELQRFNGNGKWQPDHMIGNSVSILIKALENLKKMEHHLLFPDNILININEIYINTGNGKVLLAYIPDRDDHFDQTFQKRIRTLAEDMKTLYEGCDAGHFLTRFIQFIDDNNPGLDGMINILGMIRRETSYIYRASDNFRSNAFEDFSESGSCGGNGEVEQNQQKNTSKRNEPKLIKKRRMSVWFCIALIVFVLIIGAAVLLGKFDGL